MRDGRTRRLSGSQGTGLTFEEFDEAYQACVVVLDGEAAGSEFHVTRRTVLVGRGPGVDVAVAHDSLSRQHAAIEFIGGGFRVRDLGSTNGLSVRGRRVEAAPLEHGDRFILGELTFQFLVEARDVEPETYELTLD